MPTKGQPARVCVALVCGCLLAGCQVQKATMPQLQRPLLVISYDDGLASDYQKMFAVHRRHNVPAEICVVSDWVGKAGHLTRERILEMQAAGWEVVSHSKRHNSLGTSPLTKPASPGDTKIFILQGHHFKPGTTCLLQGGTAGETILVKQSGSDLEGKWLLVEKGITSAYAAGATVRIADEEAQAETKGSKDQLEAMGFRVDSFSYPFTTSASWSRPIVARHYLSAREGSGSYGSLGLPPGLNIPGKTRFDQMNCESYETLMTKPRQLAELLDRTVADRGLCFLFMHSNGVRAEKVEELIVEAKRRGIAIVTRRQALAQWGISR